jgi:hypothetical protein
VFSLLFRYHMRVSFPNPISILSTIDKRSSNLDPEHGFDTPSEFVFRNDMIQINVKHVVWIWLDPVQSRPLRNILWWICFWGCTYSGRYNCRMAGRSQQK